MGVLPTKNNITQKFSHTHKGLDYDDVPDPNVYAYEDGRVIQSVDRFSSTWRINTSSDPWYKGVKRNLSNNDYGNYFILIHPDGTKTLYAHLRRGTVPKIGTEFKKGERTGALMGNTGNSTGAHLHFEVRSKTNTPIEPEFTIEETPQKEDMYQKFYERFIEAYRKHKETIEWGDDKNKPEKAILEDSNVIGRMIDAVAQDKKNKEDSLKNDFVSKEWRDRQLAEKDKECQLIIDQKVVDWTNEKNGLLEEIRVYKNKFGEISTVPASDNVNQEVKKPFVQQLLDYFLKGNV